MKTLLTIAVCRGTPETAVTDGVEFIYPEKDENQKDFLTRSAKTAKGKYTVISETAAGIAEIGQLLNIIDKNPKDLICFEQGFAVKTAIFKACAKDCKDAFSCKVLCVLECKSILKTVYFPLTFGKFDNEFDENSLQGLLCCAETFGKYKSKIEKEIYSYASALICDRLVPFYMYAMLAIKQGKMNVDGLAELDGTLKAEIVLYLALEKKFTASKLHKLREKGYRISFLTERKFRKLLK